MHSVFDHRTTTLRLPVQPYCVHWSYRTRAVTGMPSTSSLPNPGHRRDPTDLPAAEDMSSAEPNAASEQGINSPQGGLKTQCQETTDGGTKEVAAYLAYEQFQREYAARYARYEQPLTSGGRHNSKVTAIVVIFFLGALVGLGAASWTGLKPPDREANDIADTGNRQLSLAAVAESRQVRTESEGRELRGIRRGELPYDGEPLPKNSEGLQEFASALKPANSSTGITSPKSHPVDAGGNNGNGRSDALEENKPNGITLNLYSVPRTFSQIEGEPSKRQSDGTFQTKVAPKKHPENKIPSVEEITTARASSRHSQSSAKLRAHTVQGRLARCERLTNIFVREQCRWRLCSDSWGKNGCPSYSRPIGNTVN